MKNDIFNQLIQNQTLILNIVLDYDYLSNFTNLSNEKKQNLFKNQTFLELVKAHQKIIFTSSQAQPIVIALEQSQLLGKYVSLDLEGFNYKQLVAILKKQLPQIEQIRLCYLFNNLIKLELNKIIDKFSEFNGCKILLIYLKEINSFDKDFGEQLFFKAKQCGITLNILPLPRAIINSSAQEISNYESIFNSLRLLEEEYKTKVFYDFPCGSVLDKHFEGFCPGYFSSIVSPGGNVLFCKFSNISFGNILDKDLKEIKNNRINYFTNMPLSNCCDCKYYLTCGGGCLVDLDRKGQKNLICFL